MSRSDELLAADFARDLEIIGDAFSAVMAQLDAVLAQQRQGILALAEFGADPDETLRQAAESIDALSSSELSLPQAPNEKSPLQERSPVDEGTARFARSVALHGAASSLSLAFHNAVAQQQLLNTIGQAVVARKAAALLEE